MKRTRSSYDAPSPCLSEYQPQHPVVEQYAVENAQTHDFTELFEHTADPTHSLDPLQQYLGSYVEPYDVQANTSNQSAFVGSSVDAQRSTSQAQQSSPQHNGGSLRGRANCAESPGVIGVVTSTYNTHRRSYSAASQASVLTPMRNPPAASAEPSEARPTPYSPYRGLFSGSDAARDHRHVSTRFGRRPYIHPEDDYSIEEVERNRSYHVGRIYNAMICGDRAQDNAGSIAVKRWVHGAHYKSDLVEAFAHKVFDCLLVQVKEGFRGWHHNDYVDDDRKGEKEDREADCATRLDNIIDALEREKTVCEDVVNSASQIRMFVNAPIAYAQRKLQNRQGNSKRVRARDKPASNPRPTKMRRTRAGPVPSRSIALTDRPMSRDTTPQFQISSSMPYYASEASRQVPSSPTSTFFIPRQPLQQSALSMLQEPAGYRKSAATAPPMMAHTRSLPPPTATKAAMSPPMMPPAQMLPAQIPPLPPTPSQSYTYHSAPATPEDAGHPIYATSPEDWPKADTFTTSAYTPIDPSLTASALFPQDPWPGDVSAQPEDFKQLPTTHISLADIEHAGYQTVGSGAGDAVSEFESFWNEIPGVQPFAFVEPANEAKDRC